MIDKVLYWFVTVSVRSLALVFAGCLVLIMFGAVMVARAGNPPVPPVTNTQIAAQATRTAVATLPEPTAQTGLGAPISLNGWTISLERMEMRQCVSYLTMAGDRRVENQPHYLFWISAKNESDQTRSLRRSIVWSIRTEGDHIYYARLDQDFETGLSGSWIKDEGREYLSTDVPAGGETRTLVTFRTFTYRPITLMISSVEAQPQIMMFDLSKLEPVSSSAGCQ